MWAEEEFEMRVLCIAILFGSFSIGVSGQNGVSISGKVLFEGRPVAGANVNIAEKSSAGARHSAIADDQGRYSIYAPPGNYILTVTGTSAAGAVSAAPIEIKIRLDDPISMDIEVVRPVIRETVNISAAAEQPIEHVSKSVNVISGQEMRERADITLVDSLRTIPGFRVQQLGGFGRTASIKTRGLRNQDTAVLIDGMRFRDAASITGDASAYISDITLTSVTRVEVLRGPGSSLYGTNAIGGTIDLHTPLPRPGWHGQLSVAGGGLGLGRFRGNIGNGTQDGKAGFNMAVSRTVVADGIDGDDRAENTNVQTRLEFNPTSRTNISGRIFFSDAFVALNSNPDTAGTLPPSNSVIIDARPGVNYVPDTNDPDNSQSSRYFSGQFVISHAVGSDLNLQGHYSGVGARRKNENGVLGVGFQSESTSFFDGDIHTGNLHLDWTPNRSHRVTAGYEFEHESFRNEGVTPSGTGDFFTDASQSGSTIFVQDLMQFAGGRLQIAGGVRAQFFRLGTPNFSLSNAPYSGMDGERPPSAVTFDGAASYFFSGTGTKLRIHGGSGYRIPSLYERFGTFFSTFPTNSFGALGDPMLKPERSAAFDAGIEQYFFGRKAALSATYFYTRLIDTIGFGFPVSDIGSTTRPFGGYLNTKGGISRGVELSANIKARTSTDFYFSYTFTNSDQREPQVGGTNVRDTLGVPDHQVTFNVTQRIKAFWVNADLVATSSYLAPIFSNSTFNTYLYRFGGNRRLDLTAGHNFRIKGDRYSLRVFGTIENLLDHEYFENGFRTIGRLGRVGVSFGF